MRECLSSLQNSMALPLLLLTIWQDPIVISFPLHLSMNLELLFQTILTTGKHDPVLVANRAFLIQESKVVSQLLVQNAESASVLIVIFTFMRVYIITLVARA